MTRSDALALARRLSEPDAERVELPGGIVRLNPHFSDPDGHRTGWSLDMITDEGGNRRLAVFTDAEINRGLAPAKEAPNAVR